MSEVATEPTSSIAIPPKKKGGRPKKASTEPKGKPGRPKKVVETVEGHEVVVEAPKPKESGTINGWPIAEGFSRIMLFKRPMDGDQSFPETFVCGDRPPVTLYRGVMHVVPNCIVSIIQDTVNEYPADDLTDPQHPRRSYVKLTQYPHSDPIPAAPQEYRAYVMAEKAKKSAADYIRDKMR